MTPLDRRVAAIAATAEAWRDPEHTARAEAVRQSLANNDLYTSESIAFALNQAMHAATDKTLHDWIGERQIEAPGLIAVWTNDPQPLAGWRDLLAVALSGHAASVRLAETSPYLLPAFFAEVRASEESLDVRFDAEAGLSENASVVLGTGTDEAMASLAARCEDAGIPEEHRRLMGEWIAVAVTDGRETPDERVGLAEDALLHAESRRRVRILWAPERQSPDPLLDALSGFRELFPAPAALDGRLQMPRAFLEAAGTPHAWGDGFLVSNGPPEPQPAGHLRWAEYRDLEDVSTWLGAHRIGLVVAAPRVLARLSWLGPTAAPGDAHRPQLGCADPFDLLGLG